VRIGIDYTSAAHQGAGIGRLTRNAVGVLAQIDTANQYTLLIQGRELPADVGCPPDDPCPATAPQKGLRNAASGIRNDNFAEVRTWIGERWWTRIWHRFHLPLCAEWIVGQVDLFHGPDFTLPPLRARTKAIVTVHDLSYLRLPNCFKPALLNYLVDNVPRAVSRADWVLADSMSTRRDVIELLKVPEDKVSVLYPGVESRFRPITDARTLADIRQKYGLPERYILSVGTIQPRKNYERLVQAFSMLEAQDASLVIVGGKGWLYERLFQQVQDLELRDRVCFAGYVKDVDLPVVYNLAYAFVFPSLYEGFGIPPLEAMACGVPVIAADNSSLPEVVGDAGLLIDAQDTEALAHALSQLLDDSALCQRLVDRGLARAKQFTWERAAHTLLSTYEHVGRM
jgi:glycosyltransferase involved in cell wall biosynthesis